MQTLLVILLVLAAGVLLASCDKNAVQDITGPETGTRIKFFNFGVNAPSVNFYANDAKLTGTVKIRFVVAKKTGLVEKATLDPAKGKLIHIAGDHVAGDLGGEEGGAYSDTAPPPPPASRRWGRCGRAGLRARQCGARVSIWAR